jgi:hypothetical protein
LGSWGVSFSAGGLEVSAGARCGENWSVYASGEKRRSCRVSWWSRGGLGGIAGVRVILTGIPCWWFWRPSGCFGGASAESAVLSPQGHSMLVSAVSVVSGLFQCWSCVQSWVWCDDNLSAYASEETRCSGCRASRRSEQAPCIKNVQYINGPHSIPYQSIGSAGLVVPLIRIEHMISHVRI